MEDSTLSREQEAEIEILGVEFEQQLSRVGVDLQAASAQMREMATHVEHRLSDDESEVILSMDVAVIVEILRGLSDGAGTAAFLAACRGRRNFDPSDV